MNIIIWGLFILMMYFILKNVNTTHKMEEMKEVSVENRILDPLDSFPKHEILEKAEKIMLDYFLRKKYRNVLTWENATTTDVSTSSVSLITITFTDGGYKTVMVKKISSVIFQLLEKDEEEPDITINVDEEVKNFLLGYSDQLDKLEKQAKNRGDDAFIIPITDLPENDIIKEALVGAVGKRGYSYVSLEDDGLLIGPPL